MTMFHFVFLLQLLLVVKFSYAAETFSKMFEVRSGLDDNGQAVFWSSKSPSVIACVAQGLTKPGCLAVVYDDVIHTCSFLNSTTSLIETSDEGFSYIFVGDYCLEGWVEFSGNCYLFGNQRVSWGDALDFCNMHDATLVEIETSAENAFIQMTLGNIVNQEHWIGMTDQVEEGVWVWASGAVATYTDWGIEQPNEGLVGNCAAIWATFSYQWVDEACSNLFYPICEKESTIVHNI